MCTFTCGLVTSIIGGLLVIGTSIVTFGVVPGLVVSIIEDNFVLINDTIQLERFEEVPVALNVSVRIFNISNAADVLNGAVPVVKELGPYVYRLYQRRVVENLGEELVTYRIEEHYEFDSDYSFPHTEDDMVTIANVAYNGVLQVAESMFPSLMDILNNGLNGIFGPHSSPIMTVRVGDLMFDGISLCQNPGFVGTFACIAIRELSADVQNIALQDDNSLLFSLLSYRAASPSNEYIVHRGLVDSADLGRIISYNHLPHLTYWADTEDEVSVCNMLNGTDSGIFAPFVDRETSIYALNTDICRSVELRYQYDLEFEGIPAVRYTANEWFLDNDEGCFCLNVTRGINRPDGCLLRGALELYTCVGAFLVLSYPHFLYADPLYRNGLIGLNPIEEEHRITLDIEPNTGTVVRGNKRGQFNIFLRPVTGIPATQNLRTTLMPVFWVEEGVSLPEEFLDEIRTRLLLPLTLVDILLPILVAICCVVFLLGIAIIIRAKTKSSKITVIESARPMPRTTSDVKTQ